MFKNILHKVVKVVKYIYKEVRDMVNDIIETKTEVELAKIETGKEIIMTVGREGKNAVMTVGREGKNAVMTVGRSIYKSMTSRNFRRNTGLVGLGISAMLIISAYVKPLE